MTEAVLNVVQLGRQSVVGTSVAATTVFPVDAGFTGFDLDRASESPDEDFGIAARQYPGRSSTGVRWATATASGVIRYQDFVHILEQHVDTIGTPTGTAGGTCTYPYIFDESTGLISGAVKPYTWEYGVEGSTQDEWEATGVIINELEIGFDALTAPGNSMWTWNASLVALNRAPATITADITPPATLETAEGHLTTFAEGSTATAFASLSAVSASLKQFTLRSNLNAIGRAYGGSSDIATAIGRSAKAEVSGDALIAISSTAKSDILDIFEVSGSVPTERRWRIEASGSGVNKLTIDLRVVFRATNVGESEGERLYAVEFDGVYDSTLTGRGKIQITNAVTSIP